MKTDMKTPKTQTKKAPNDVKNFDVLVVDDETALTRALKLKLENQNISVDVAENGKIALEKLESQKYKAILLDLVMPELDGFGVLEVLAKKKERPNILVATNLGQEEDMLKVKTYNVQEYFVKANTTLAEMITLLKKYIK